MEAIQTYTDEIIALISEAIEKIDPTYQSELMKKWANETLKLFDNNLES